MEDTNKNNDQLEIRIGSDIILLDISDLQLSEDVNAINKSLSDHASKYQKIATLLIRAKFYKEQTEHALLILRGEVELAIRESSEKKPTEKMIETMVNINSGVKILEKELIDARKQEGLLNALKESYQHRKDTLIVLAQNLRGQFYNSNPVGI